MSSPYINRFLQPDTVIPDPSNPQSWNRYSYVTNRPVNFNDPTGHKMTTDSDGGSCDADCWKNLQKRRKLQKELDNFDPPKIVDRSAMEWVGRKYNHSEKQWEDVYLAPGEYDLLSSKLPRAYNTHNALDYFNLARMFLMEENATNTTYDLFSHEDPFAEMHNSPSDAFHHAYWSALITRELGADFAEQFTTAHETRLGSYQKGIYGYA